MVTSESIRLNIAQGMATEYLSVAGDDGTHFEAVVVSNAFTGKSRVQRHQLVYQTLGERMREEKQHIAPEIGVALLASLPYHAAL